MKKNRHIGTFLGGFVTALVLTACLTTALAASGTVSYNFANVALDGTQKITAGQDITAANGQKVPGSILYTDAAGGKTNYLPIRAISELLGVEIGYDSATKTVLLGKQSASAPAPAAGTEIDLRTPAEVPKNARHGNSMLITSRGGTLLPDDDPTSYRGADKMFKDKNGEIRYEYLVGNEGALDDLDKKVAEKHLANGDYPKNSKGESYGPEQLANYVGYAPDLLYVPEEGDHPVGYYRQSERTAAETKMKGLSKDACPHTIAIPLYDAKGNVIGEYQIGCSGHIAGSGMSIEDAMAAAEKGER